MKMKPLAFLTLLAATAGMASQSQAAQPTTLEFSAAKQSALVTIQADKNLPAQGAGNFFNSFSFSASGSTGSFNAIAYSVFDGETPVYQPGGAGKVTGNSYSIGYNDYLVNSFDFAAGKTYTVKVDANLTGAAGTGLFSIKHGNVVGVTMVPEVETYAMLLAGLGLIGAIVRRRASVR